MCPIFPDWFFIHLQTHTMVFLTMCFLLVNNNGTFRNGWQYRLNTVYSQQTVWRHVCVWRLRSCLWPAACAKCVAQVCTPVCFEISSFMRPRLHLFVFESCVELCRFLTQWSERWWDRYSLLHSTWFSSASLHTQN